MECFDEMKGQIDRAAHSTKRNSFHNSLWEWELWLNFICWRAWRPRECIEWNANGMKTFSRRQRNLIVELVFSLCGWVMGWWASQWLRPKKRTKTNNSTNQWSWKTKESEWSEIEEINEINWRNELNGKPSSNSCAASPSTNKNSKSINSLFQKKEKWKLIGIALFVEWEEL